jgi:hypothetical protein
LLSEARRIDQIAEQHRQLAAFGVRGGEGRGDILGRVLWPGLCITNPYQHSTALINGQPLRLDEFVLEGLKLLIVQAELHFEGAI